MVIITLEINHDAWLKARTYALEKDISAYDAYANIFMLGMNKLLEEAGK